MSSSRFLLLPVIVVCLAVALVFFYTAPVGSQNPSIEYHESVIQHYVVGEPPIVFGFMIVLRGFLDPVVTWIVATVSVFVAGIIAMYCFVRELSGNYAIALLAALQYGTSSLVVVLFMYGYVKQLMGLALIPIAIYYFHRGLHTERERYFLMSGIVCGIVGLTHEISFVSLVVFYFAFWGVRSGFNGKLNMPTFYRIVITFVPVFLICGWLYTQEFGAITHAMGNTVLNYSVFYVVSYCLLGTTIVVSIVGLASVREHRVLLWSMVLGALVLVLGWVGYQDRFMIQAVIPLSVLSAYGFYRLYELRKRLGVLLCVVAAGNILTLLLLFVRPSDIINNGFNLLYFPIGVVSMLFDGMTGIMMKIVVGVPFTLIFWVVVGKTIYRRCNSYIAKRL